MMRVKTKKEQNDDEDEKGTRDDDDEREGGGGGGCVQSEDCLEMRGYDSWSVNPHSSRGFLRL